MLGSVLCPLLAHGFSLRAGEIDYLNVSSVVPGCASLRAFGFCPEDILKEIDTVEIWNGETAGYKEPV